MSHVEVPEAAHRGELPELRGGGAAESLEVSPVRTAERGASSEAVALEIRAAAPGESGGRSAPEAPEGRLSVGDRVDLAGRVSLTGETSKGEQWVMVALDGEPAHSVACWTSNVKAREP